jgi:hypothetical protein
MSVQAKCHVLNLTFKGDRDYLHGTDIVPALVAIAGQMRGLSVQIYRMTSHVLLAWQVTAAELEELRKSRELCVLMSYTRPAGEAAMIAVTEDRSRRVIAARPYDEAAVVRTAVRDGKRIRQDASRTGTFLERIVALNKRLLNELEGKSDWLFCGLELTRIPEPFVPLSIEMVSNVGTRMYKSAIEVSGLPVGTLVFAKRGG